jgi:hypothetical protein
MTNVYILPSQGEKLGLSEAGMQCGHDEGLRVWAAMWQEQGFFFLGKEPNPPIIFSKCLPLFQGVFDGFYPGYSYGKQILQER